MSKTICLGPQGHSLVEPRGPSITQTALNMGTVDFTFQEVLKDTLLFVQMMKRRIILLEIISVFSVFSSYLQMLPLLPWPVPLFCSCILTHTTSIFQKHHAIYHDVNKINALSRNTRHMVCQKTFLSSSAGERGCVSFSAYTLTNELIMYQDELAQLPWNSLL